jgi:hypothetical protein
MKRENAKPSGGRFLTEGIRYKCCPDSPLMAATVGMGVYWVSRYFVILLDGFLSGSRDCRFWRLPPGRGNYRLNSLNIKRLVGIPIEVPCQAAFQTLQR